MKTIRIFLSLFVLLVGFKGVSQNTLKTTHIVIIDKMAFRPAELVVRSGDTVKWINKGIVPHNVTEKTAKAWGSPLLKPGESWEKVITGDVEYYCSIHITMKGGIKVKPPE